MDKKKKNAALGEWSRHRLQLIWAFITNSYLVGFVQGKIYQGRLKSLCVPGLNCYSCPGALGSCPIGSLQAVIGSRNYKFSFYVFGILVFFGSLMGRFVCGFLCPFGLIQDLLHKIPFPKKLKAFRGDRLLRWAKYAILMLFVIIMPMFIVDILGQGFPFFCKYICPAGTLEGGLPLVLMNKALHKGLGFLYAWKNLLLVITIIGSIIIYRPFCKYVCPLGAIYSVFNPIAIFRYRTDESKCISCGACSAVCKMGCDPSVKPNDLECIRCGGCIKVCPTSAITKGFSGGTGTLKSEKAES
ncbi:4Fe-4S binding protein [Clostridiaceae bacterium OttesenSCG-928-D20]|nr:4Fe-4S binding protein [Clostridiaceae bacterium OttesenSCG-928-D20]